MKNKEHSNLQKELNEIITTINVYIVDCKETKRILSFLYDRVYENPRSEWYKKHKARMLKHLTKDRIDLATLEQEVITLKRQIKDCQRANNKAFIEYNNNKQKERLKAMNIDIQDNNKTKVITLKQIIDSKQ